MKTASPQLAIGNQQLAMPRWIHRFRIVRRVVTSKPPVAVTRFFLTRSGCAWVEDARHAGIFTSTRKGASAIAATHGAQAEDAEGLFVL